MTSSQEIAHITDAAKNYRVCRQCGGPVRTAFFNASIIAHASVLYAYFKLLACEARFCAPNVWSCDACKIAGPIL